MTLNPAVTFQKANTLLADHLFSPALFLAERIERGLIPVEGKTGQFFFSNFARPPAADG
jgi:hypothetical protein